MGFEWIPRQGIQTAALARLKAHFPQPTEPPFEAWFMGKEIHYHRAFLKYAPAELDLENYWYDTGGGIRSFGRFREWVMWYHYFLPHVLPLLKTPDYNDLPLLIGYFINLYSRGVIRPDSSIPLDQQRDLANADYPGGIPEVYPGFRADILHTLGQAFMEPLFWPSDPLNPLDLWNDTYASPSFWRDCLYASSFFCLMYLTPAEIETWVASLARHSDATWQHELALWVTGLRRFLHFYQHPKAIPDDTAHRQPMTLNAYLDAAGINWHRSRMVFNGLYSSLQLNDYIPDKHFQAFWEAVEKYPQIRVGDPLAKRVYYIDGRAFRTWPEFYRALEQTLAPGISLEPSHFQLHQILSGRVGSHGYDTITLIWQHFAESQHYFGFEASAAFAEKSHHEKYKGLSEAEALQLDYDQVRQDHPSWDEATIQAHLAASGDTYHASLRRVAELRQHQGISNLDSMIEFIQCYPNIQLKFEA